MAYKAYVGSVVMGDQSGVNVTVEIADITNNVIFDNAVLVLGLGTDLTTFTTAEYQSALVTKILAYSVTQSYGLTTSDIIWGQPTARSFNNTPGASIVTGTGATGTQISAIRDSIVSYSPTMVTTASISGNASDVIVLEICPTNSATAGNWIEIARVTNAQALSLTITLQSVQTTSGVLHGIVPAGYYRKIRAITSGTVTNSMSSGQEVLV